MGAGVTFRVGHHIVDLDQRRVFLNGSTVKLGWRHFEVLRLLLEADGKVVKKEEFFDRVWEGQHVDESNLTKCVAQLRQLLNNGGNEDFLETVPRVGYRLAVPAQREASPPSRPAEVPPVIRHRGRPWWTAAAVAVALAGIAFSWRALADWRRTAEADAAYQEGVRMRRLKDTPAMGSAIEWYRKAIELNPNNARYYASMAEALTKVQPAGAEDTRLMRDTAARGVALDPRCAGCNAVLGFILFTRFWDWEGAERHLSQALELNPADAGSRGYYAMLLSARNRGDEALKQIETGIGKDAYHSTLYLIQSGVLYFLKRYPDASAAAARAAAFGRQQDGAWDWHVYSRVLDGDPSPVMAALANSGVPSYAGIDAAFRARGLAGAARNVLEVTKEWPHTAWRRAHWRMILGDRSGALDELETAYRLRLFDLMYIAVDPMFEPLRSDPRFCRIVAGMNLKPGDDASRPPPSGTRKQGGG